MFGGAQDLEAAGIERKHAEAIAKVVNHGDERAATKADLDTAVTALRSELRADLAGIEARMYRALRIQGGTIVHPDRPSVPAALTFNRPRRLHGRSAVNGCADARIFGEQRHLSHTVPPVLRR